MKAAIDRLTPLGVMVLALLREDDMHPYEMIRLLRNRREDRLVAVTNGTLYHTVARLERLGLIAETGVDRDGRRPERTSYTLTEIGREIILEWVRRELRRTDRPGDFRVAIAEAHNLERDELLPLLRERRTALGELRAKAGALLANAFEQGVPEQYLVEPDLEHALLDSELDWLDRFIGRLERREFAWGPGSHPPSPNYLEQRKAARQ